MSQENEFENNFFLRKRNLLGDLDMNILKHCGIDAVKDKISKVFYRKFVQSEYPSLHDILLGMLECFTQANLEFGASDGCFQSEKVSQRATVDSHLPIIDSALRRYIRNSLREFCGTALAALDNEVAGMIEDFNKTNASVFIDELTHNTREFLDRLKSRIMNCISYETYANYWIDKVLQFISNDNHRVDLETFEVRPESGENEYGTSYKLAKFEQHLNPKIKRTLSEVFDHSINLVSRELLQHFEALMQIPSNLLSATPRMFLFEKDAANSGNWQVAVNSSQIVDLHGYLVMQISDCVTNRVVAEVMRDIDQVLMSSNTYLESYATTLELKNIIHEVQAALDQLEDIQSDL